MLCFHRWTIDVAGIRGYGKSVKVGEIIKLIESYGWYQIEQKGSHRQFKHPEIKGRVTVAGKPSQDLTKATASSVLKQAGLGKDVLRR